MYKIIRCYLNENKPDRAVKSGLTLEEAQKHCQDPETSWKTATSAKAKRRTRLYGPWHDVYEET